MYVRFCRVIVAVEDEATSQSSGGTSVVDPTLRRTLVHLIVQVVISIAWIVLRRSRSFIVHQQTLRNRPHHWCDRGIAISVEAIAHRVFYRVLEAGAGDEAKGTTVLSVAAPVSEQGALDPGARWSYSGDRVFAGPRER
ncbi:hypothetical protein BS47DRAFT_1399103 [Hydnum rufescens UP504]|uniref:Uncharacterized protein n=1 Tax=Hydnum rufescens UP504 TaxID=1448309 RepID=A0A9P6AJA1_9AGAM|nr:hypothetical protein BS47DRAFT_1399103 [Hydnum rufescens UP504]